MRGKKERKKERAREILEKNEREKIWKRIKENFR